MTPTFFVPDFCESPPPIPGESSRSEFIFALLALIEF